MTDSKFTRCPGCATVFRITAAQLALREGQVRCGHCRAVFDANDHFVSLEAAPPPDTFEPPFEDKESRDVSVELPVDEAAAAETAVADAVGDDTAADGSIVHATAVDDAAGDATAVAENGAKEAAHGDAAEAADTQRPREEESAGEGAADREPADEGAAAAEAADRGSTDEGAAAAEAASRGTAGEGAAEPRADAGTVAVTAATEEAASAADRSEEAPTAEPASDVPPGAAALGAALGGPADRFEWKKRKARAVPTRFYGIAAAALVIGLLLQLVVEYRDALAAHVPATRPLLATACKPLGCAIAPLRDGAALSIEASDLQADPAHRGLLLLSATIRNRAGHAIAFPYLELTLTNASDSIVVRRAFSPGEYAGSSADLAAGIPPNGEHVVRLFIDASATQQAGYRVYLFYP